MASRVVPTQSEVALAQVGALAEAIGNASWAAARLALRAIERAIPGAKTSPKFLPYLRDSVSELEDQASAAAPGSVAAVTAKRLAIETRARVEELTAPKVPPLPRGATRLDLLRRQLAMQLAEAPTIKARDANAWIRLQAEIRITSEAIAAIESAEATQAATGSDEEQEAALVEAMVAMAPARRSRILGALDARLGLAQRGGQ